MSVCIFNKACELGWPSFYEHEYINFINSYWFWINISDLLSAFCFGNAICCCHSFVLLDAVFSRRNALSSYQAVDAVNEAYLISYIHSLKYKLNHTKIQLIDQHYILETISLSFHSLVDRI